MTRTWMRYCGLVVPPLAWAATTQVGQITPYIDCRQHVPWTAAFCSALLLVSAAGATASRLSQRPVGRTERFVVDAGFLIASAFVFALILQGAASMLLDPCQR
ncbi:hypothetical protein DTW90_32990 [Neorhizobium sp. P12A]|nr:hypothetical protein DTW90_32990 [Neorhizobium sp. P12A]